LRLRPRRSTPVPYTTLFRSCSAGDARRNVLSRVSHLKHISGADRVVMHLTHGASSKGDRFLAATTQPYQGQRQSGRKPNNWAFLDRKSTRLNSSHVKISYAV